MTRNNLPEDVREAALALRNDDDSRFTGSESPRDVAFAVLEDEIAELQEAREEAQERQEELRAKMDVPSDESNESGAEELSEAAQKRQELRSRFGK